MSELVAEMRNAIITLGGERSWSETRQRWLERAARSAGISYRTAYSFFYAQGRDYRASAVEKVRRAIAARTNEAAVADRYEQLASKIARLEAALLSYEERDRMGAAGDGRMASKSRDFGRALASEITDNDGDD